MPQNDDFFSASNVHLDIQCSTGRSVYEYNATLPLFASISIFCYVYLLWMYFILNSAMIKRHPSQWSVYSSVFGIIYVQQYLWVNVMDPKIFYRDYSESPPHYCNANRLAAFFSFCSQASQFGRILCFLTISIDLRYSFTNPFSSYKKNLGWYYLLVYGGALLSGILLLLMGEEAYGLTSVGTLWIQDRRDHSFTWAKFLLYYFPVLAIFLYWSFAWTSYTFQLSMEGGFSKVVSHRLAIMKRSQGYTLAYMIFEGMSLLLEFLSYIYSGESTALLSLIAYIHAIRGVYSVGVVFYCNKDEFCWDTINPFKFSPQTDKLVANVAHEGLLLQPHLNVSLRAEILYFTTQGIIHSSREYLKHKLDPEIDVDSTAVGHATLVPSFRSSTIGRGSEQMEGKVFSYGENRSSATGTSRSRTPVENQSSTETDSNRSTIAELERLQLEQSNAVSRDMHVAFIDEIESLGLQSAFLQDTRRGRSFPNGQIMNPMTDEAKEQDSIAMEMRPTLPGDPSIVSQGGNHLTLDDLERQVRSSSRSSTSTVKWRETIDIQFELYPHSDLQNSTRESEQSSMWSKIRSIASSFPTKIDNDGHLHTVSTSERIKQSLRSAASNAAKAADSVFSEAYQHFTFKEYCPKLFFKVRTLSNVSPEDYSTAFAVTCKANFTEGRSGSFMFYSSNQKYIAKSVGKSELLALYNILPEYVIYLRDHPGSLLVRYLGAYCITMYGQNIFFLVMLNMLPKASRISERYDLKGSWVARHGFKGGRKQFRGSNRSDEAICPLYFDNDLRQKLNLPFNAIERLAFQIKLDVTFLRDLNFMDYSLIIGTRHETFQVLNPEEASNYMRGTSDGRVPSMQSVSDDEHQFKVRMESTTVDEESVAAKDSFGRDADGGIRACVVEGPAAYYIGIIDVLQQWNFKKWGERMFKKYFKLLDEKGLSAMEPVAYADRFWKRAVVDTFEGLDGANIELDDYRTSRLRRLQSLHPNSMTMSGSMQSIR